MFGGVQDRPEGSAKLQFLPNTHGYKHSKWIEIVTKPKRLCEKKLWFIVSQCLYYKRRKNLGEIF